MYDECLLLIEREKFNAFFIFFDNTELRYPVFETIIP